MELAPGAPRNWSTTTSRSDGVNGPRFAFVARPIFGCWLAACWTTSDPMIRPWWKRCSFSIVGLADPRAPISCSPDASTLQRGAKDGCHKDFQV
eukprot:scaffold7099_cov281-Pinguiococcus_pyrenoidosus.AAC.10